MSQRNSGYARKAFDQYETPAWVTKALINVLPTGVHTVLEPAAGSGKMVRVLRAAGYKVTARDIQNGADFLRTTAPIRRDALITNPPYGMAQEFIEAAMQRNFRVIAMLLRTDYDHAVTRQHLFNDCKIFSMKLVLTRRIVWFEPQVAAPSYNHAWFIWDRKHRGWPKLAYGQ